MRWDSGSPYLKEKGEKLPSREKFGGLKNHRESTAK